MTDNPLVSVVIPFFNGAAFLPDAINSVFSQTYQCWELLLVDDGSTDTSSDIARQYATQHHPRVRYLTHDGCANKGASASRNLGIRHAIGKYLAFLDADDVWLPHKLEQQVAILETHPDAAMVYGPGLWWYGWTGNVEDSQRDYVQDIGLPPNTLLHPPTLLTLFLRNEYVIPSSMAILTKRDLLVGLGGSEETNRSVYDDQVVFAKLILEAPVFVSGECWYKYRQHENQRCYITISTGQHDAARRMYLHWLQEYLSKLGIQDREVWTILHGEVWRLDHPRVHRIMDLSRRFLRRRR